MRFVLNFLLAFLCLLAPALAGEDEGLYEPPPPAGSAWLRYVGQGELSIGSLHLVAPTYALIMQGSYTAAVASEQIPVVIGAGHRYTLAGSPLYLFEDPVLENRARSLLVVYNLSDRPAISLTTADSKLTVLKDIVPHKAFSRMVQPIKVALAIKEGENLLATLPELQLERGASYSIIVQGAGSAVTARLLKNEISQAKGG